MAELRIRLLGGLDVEGLAARDVGSRKARTLVKLLALARGAPVNPDRIVDVLWGDVLPARPVEQIGVLVSRLRLVLGADRVQRGDAGWSLAVDWLDVAELERRVDEAHTRLRAGSPAAALAAARAALMLVRGELLADEPDAWWADVERAAAARTIARARVLAAEAALVAGDVDDAFAAAERALDHDPYDEAALRVLMRSLAAAGRPASALAAYARIRERLIEDLGVSPTVETEDLHKAILLSPPAPPRTPLTGRDAELAALDLALDHASSGGAVAVVIEGEAGIGKTTLVRAWAANAAARALVVTGRCDELGRELPLQPVLDALAEHLRDTDLDVGSVPDTATGRAALFANLLAVIERSAGDRPAVVIIEDIHVAGMSTLEWLAFAARRGRRLLVIATTRDRSLPATRTLTLGPLGLDAVRSIVGDERAVELHARSGGHPLFLVELANAAGELPTSVRDAVTARVDALGDAASTLRTAAVLGEIDVDLLAGVLGLPVPELLEHVDAGVAARIIDESLRFRHDLVREALARGTNAARREFVHREAARVLRERPGSDPLAVAFHAQQGGDLAGAARALVDAASVAEARFDTVEAERLLDRAIGMADTPAARIARARIRIGHWDIAGARADARAAGAKGLEVAAWAEYYGRDYDLALRYADEAMARAPDDAARASCLAMTGRILHSRGDLHRADERLTRAVQTAPPEVCGFARVWLAGLRIHQGDPEAAGELVERALVEGRWLGHPYALHHGGFFRALSLGHRGRVPEALHACDTAEHQARAAGEAGVRFVAAIENTRSWLLRGVGCLDEADEISDRVFASTGQTAQTMEMHCVAALDLLEGHLLRGDLEGAASAMERARVVETFLGTMAWHQRERFTVQQARLALAAGERERAVELAAAARADAAERGAGRYEVLAGVLTGDLQAVAALDRVAGIEAWWLTAELAARTGDDRLWREAERRAGALVTSSGAHADALRAWVTARFSALGRR